MLLNGTHAVLESLRRKSTGTLYISTVHKSYTQIVALAKKNNCTIQNLSIQEIKKRGGRQGVLFKITSHSSTYVPDLKQWLEDKRERALCILLLDHILDPQNLGAIIRSATLLDVDIIIQPEKRMAPDNQLAARSASGGMSVMPRCYEHNLANAISLLKKNDVWVYALDMDGKEISNMTLPHRCAFVLGGEYKGVSDLIRKSCDDIISIPSNRTLNSFNVSVTSAITCYEYFKQHRII